MTENQIKKIAVFCGSSRGQKTSYQHGAKKLAQSLVSHQMELVYGGAKIGLMGIIADEVMKQSGKVLGVIPKALIDVEIAHQNLNELTVCKDMHERKKIISDVSDAFIALPGGIGTLEELFEIWTWAQLGYHAKPIALFNIGGYYDKLLSFMDHVATEDFMPLKQRQRLIVAEDANTLLEKILTQKPLAISKWQEQAEWV